MCDRTRAFGCGIHSSMNWMYDSFSRLRVSGFVCFALALFAVWETQPVILLAWYHRDWVFHILCAHITQLLKLKLEHSKCKQSHYKSLCQKTIPRLRLHLTTPWMTVLKTTKALSLSLSFRPSGVDERRSDFCPGLVAGDCLVHVRIRHVSEVEESD